MRTSNTTRTRTILLWMALVVIALFICLGVSNPAPARAQEAAMETPAPAPLPLYSELTWVNLGVTAHSFLINGQIWTLNGNGYEAAERFSGGVPENVADYYSSQNLSLEGWNLIGGTGAEATYQDPSARLLTVKLAKCEDSGSEFCVRLWVSTETGPAPVLGNPPGDEPPVGAFLDPLPVPAFSQRNYSNTLGSGTGCPTIASAGCWVTAYAMVYNYYQANYTNPSALNSAIINAGLYGYNGEGCYDSMPWAPPVAPSGVYYTNAYACYDCASSYKSLIDNEIAHGRPVLAYDENAGDGHMVVITGHKNGDYQINDPWDGSTNRTLSNGALGSYRITLLILWNGAASPLPRPFGKSSPTNGNLNQPTNPTLSWASSAGASSYEYCIDATNNNSCDSSWISTGTGTTVGLANLTVGTTYYWQVRARNSDGVTTANGGSWWSFSVPLSPGAFAKVNPADGAVAQGSSLTLQWTASPGAAYYEYCLDATGQGCTQTNIWSSAGQATSYTIQKLDPDQVIEWQVRAVNVSGVTEADSGVPWTFTVPPIGQFTRAPMLPFQPNNPILSWTTSANASDYQYCLTTSPKIDCVTPWRSVGGPYNSVQLANLSRGTTYVWQVRATNLGSYVNAGGSVVDSVPYQTSFTVPLLPSAFTKISPRGQIMVTTIPGQPYLVTIKLMWNPSTNETSYQMCVDTIDNNLCDTSWVTRGGPGGGVQVAPVRPYYWQVRALNATGEFVYADNGVWWSFQPIPYR